LARVINLIDQIGIIKQLCESHVWHCRVAGNPVGFDPSQGYNGAYWEISEQHAMFCWSRYLLWLVILVLGTGGMLTACGQKGPLYLPGPASQQQAEAKDK
jgi:predicted small lipoprotein YifL